MWPPPHVVYTSPHVQLEYPYSPILLNHGPEGHSSKRTTSWWGEDALMSRFGSTIRPAILLDPETWSVDRATLAAGALTESESTWETKETTDATGQRNSAGHLSAVHLLHLRVKGEREPELERARLDPKKRCWCRRWQAKGKSQGWLQIPGKSQQKEFQILINIILIETYKKLITYFQH